MINYDRRSFFPLKKKINTTDISSLIFQHVLDKKFTNIFEILDLSSLRKLRKNSVIFSNNNLLPSESKNINFLLITDNFKLFKNNTYKNIILVKNLSHVYNLILNAIFIHEDNINDKIKYKSVNDSYLCDQSLIDKSANIGINCVIGRGVIIGKNCIIKNNVVIKNSILGDNVVISDNTTIGSTGFGFNINNMGSKNLSPQLGIVVINDNVHIGSNCTIDRGKIDETIIGQNCMLDNLIHIGHNVIIGKNVCIAAQTGISGSVIIGDNVIIGGQVGMTGHITIGNNVKIAAKSGVTKSIPNNMTVAGFPAVNINEWKRNIIKIKKWK
tara:strand:+ start:7703 stop:8683 length:981 start_codon:yes stop_codon:yes gene_type:complete